MFELEKLSVMVRGIYTTAMVKLLLNNGFEIARPSATTASRFNLTGRDEWDASVRDHPSKRAIVVEGPRAKEVVEVLQRELPDVLVNSEKQGFEIYKGVVERVEGRVSYVNYGAGLGVLNERLAEGQEVLVSPMKNEGKHLSTTPLTRRIRIVGRYADLIKDGWVSAPRGLPQDKCDELMSLGHLLKPQDWGVQWKKQAAEVGTRDLMDELQKLREEAAMIMQRASEAKAPCLVYEPPTLYVVTLPYSSKKRLDELRSSVVTTMPNHHMIKSWGRRYAYAVDVVEKLMDRLGGQVGEEASRVMMRESLKLGSKVAIEHVKPSGLVYKLTPGVVEEVDYDSMTVTLRRRFRGGGVYDGLGVPKEDGDYGLSSYMVGSPISKTRYFNSKGELKGVYVNISTPVEVAPKRVRYVDLEVDVVAKPTGEVEVLDLDKAKGLLDRGVISSSLYEKLLNVVDKVKRELEAKGDVELRPIAF
ncbi:MAG: hypothetical protein DRJ62_07330 [Thermoprotei archaeon]|nr:MAG: hypothetical protein DRJ62_07330 [Thermoprotei archaeon]